MTRFPSDQSQAYPGARNIPQRGEFICSRASWSSLMYMFTSHRTDQFSDDHRGRQPNLTSSSSSSQRNYDFASTGVYSGGSSSRHIGMDNSHTFPGQASGTNTHHRNDSVISDPHGTQNFQNSLGGYPMSAPLRSDSYDAMQLDRDSEGSKSRHRSATMPVVHQQLSQSQSSGPGQLDNRAMQGGQPSYPNQRQIVMDMSTSSPMSSGLSGSSSASKSLVPPSVVCKCGGLATDGRLTTCSSCRRTFHMTCCHIYDSSPNFKCWTCQNQASRPPEAQSTSLPAVSPPNLAAGRGSGPSLASNSFSGDRDRGERRKDVSPHPYSSASGSVPIYADGSSRSRNTDIYHPPAPPPHAQYSPPPHMPPQSSHSSYVNSGTSTTAASWTGNTGYSSASGSRSASNPPTASSSSYTSSERPPNAVRTETQTASNRARNPEPCGYCQEHRVKVRFIISG